MKPAALLFAAVLSAATATIAAADETPANPPDWGTVITPASIAAGKDAARACQGCHNLDPTGPSLEGPNLFGVVGRQPGGNPSYRYSQAMSEFGGKHDAWTYDLLFQFLNGPADLVPGTKMSFQGVPDLKARANIIAYLHSLGSDLPVPAPDPSRAAK